MRENKHWIKEALKNHKEKATHKMLGLPLEQPLPMELLEKIKATPLGVVVKYRYKGKFGWVKRSYTVTSLMWHRVNLAINLINITRKRQYANHVLKYEV